VRGEKVLSSGNAIRWTLEQGLGRGGIAVVVSAQPTAADLEEARALIDEVKPPGSQEAYVDLVVGPGAVTAGMDKLNAFLGRGSRN
jgi:hypothetical protein